MSTSVFKPIQPYRIESPRLRQPFTDKSPLKRVRRVLFEPVDHLETKLFIERELNYDNLNASSKWDFDFAREVPLNPSGTTGRYVWKPVRHPAERITFAPKRRRSIEEVVDNSNLYPQPLGKLENPLRVDENNCIVMSPPATSTEQVIKKQMKITDFMKGRKRTAESAFKKLSAPRPAKITRETCS